MHDKLVSSFFLNDFRFSSMNQLPCTAVPRLKIDDFDPKELSSPAIIEGFDIGKCLQWTPDYLRNTMGDKHVTVHKSDHPVLKFQPRNFTYETFQFDEFLTHAFDENCKSFFYLRSLAKAARDDVANFAVDYPELKADVEFPPLFEEDQFFSSVFRVSSADVELWTHFDTMDNYLLHIYGQKRVFLFPPKDVSNLYVIDDKPRVFELDNVSVESFPNLKNCSAWKCVLDPGDILFIPAFWFHNVKALNFRLVFGLL